MKNIVTVAAWLVAGPQAAMQTRRAINTLERARMRKLKVPTVQSNDVTIHVIHSMGK